MRPSTLEKKSSLAAEYRILTGAGEDRNLSHLVTFTSLTGTFPESMLAAADISQYV